MVVAMERVFHSLSDWLFCCPPLIFSLSSFLLIFYHQTTTTTTTRLATTSLLMCVNSRAFVFSSPLFSRLCVCGGSSSDAPVFKRHPRPLPPQPTHINKHVAHSLIRRTMTQNCPLLLYYLCLSLSLFARLFLKTVTNESEEYIYRTPFYLFSIPLRFIKLPLLQCCCCALI